MSMRIMLIMQSSCTMPTKKPALSHDYTVNLHVSAGGHSFTDFEKLQSDS